MPNAVLTWDGLALSPASPPAVCVALNLARVPRLAQGGVAQRVEEDYAFKEAVSRSFEGYRRELAELKGKAAPESALSRFCARVLGVITDPPRRIYERHQLNKTPLSAVAESAGPIAEVVSKLAPGQIKLGA